MKKILSILLVVCSLSLFVMCDDDDDSSDSTALSSFGLGEAAIVSLPLYTASKSVTSGTIADYSILKSFFKFECYMPGSESNFCPAGVDYTTGGDSNPYKLTSYTLLGSIYHADMYSGGLQETCETPATISAGSFVAAESGGDPAKYLLDYYSLLTCLKDNSAQETNGTSYQTYSTDANGAYQATLTTRYRVPYNGVSDPGQNDIFQVYVGLTNGEPTLLAFNYAGADTMYQRTILILNPSAHKFVVKHYEATEKKLVAIGVGGVDMDTGTMNSGYYYTKFTTDSGAEESGCVDNATGTFQSDNSACTTASIPVDWTSSDSVATYLELSADDKSRLAAFLTALNTSALPSADDSPANSTTDVEQNMPKTIQ